jgi:glycosyltransferase involved in cell wall biosynthesis
MSRNLYLGVQLAPYRLDYYNYLHDHMNCEIYFQLHSFKGQLFSTEELEKQCSFTPHYLEIIRIGGDRQIVKGLHRIIKKIDPAVIFVPEFSVLALQVIAIKKLFGYRYKIVSQCDDSYDMLVHGGFSRLHGLSRKLMMPLIDNLILLDTRAVTWYQEHYRKGIFMPLIIDEKKQNADFKKKAKNIAQALRKQYELDAVKAILFVGRLIDVKNLFALIEACRKLDFAYQLIIVGDGEMRQQLEHYAKEVGANVLFAGRQNGANLTAWYYVADAFVLPSYMEPFGAVTNEALLCGCNCCISELAGSACLIKDGENGYTCNPHSIGDIADKITKTCRLPKSELQESKMPYKFADSMDKMITDMQPLLHVYIFI